jgi:16S rRNA U516 pseudouridylate synthase RsuA-like enzyme
MAMTPQRTKRAPVPPKGRRAARGQQPPRGPKPGAAREEGPQRIAKLLARAGIASRRDVERMIAEGRIALNGEKLTTPATLLENLQGVTIEGIRYGSIDANHERRTGRNSWIEMSLTEGKNREVRNVLAFLGLQVSRLIRTSYGPFNVEGMEPGDVGEVPRDTVSHFRRTL